MVSRPSPRRSPSPSCRRSGCWRARTGVVAVDDVQWLDRPSTAVLLYAARRVAGHPVRFVLARRGEDTPGEIDFDRAIGGDRLRRVELGPLSRGAIQHLLWEQLAVSLPRLLLHRIYESSGGNPFYALELARALTRSPERMHPGEPLHVPTSLASLVAERLEKLPPETEHALQVAALLANPTVDVVGAVLGSAPALRPAIDAQVAEVRSGRIELAHPLLASSLAARIDPGIARELHRRIAEAVDDPEERARHLARAAAGPDEHAAAALDRAAAHARSRGAPEVAAELLEQALVLTPDDDGERTERLLRAADAQHAAGDLRRARELAQLAIERLPAGRDRSSALLALAVASPDPVETAEQALAEAGSDHALRARIGLVLANGYVLTDFRRSLSDAKTAVAEAEAARDPGLAAQALALRAWFEGRMRGRRSAPVAR